MKSKIFDLRKRTTGVIKLIVAAFFFFAMVKINEINYQLSQEGIWGDYVGYCQGSDYAGAIILPFQIMLMLLFISILASYAFFVSAIVDIVAGDDVKKLRKTGMLMWVISLVLIPFLLPYGILWSAYRNHVLIMLVGFSIAMEVLIWYNNKQISMQKIFDLRKRTAGVIKLIVAAFFFFAMVIIIVILSWMGQHPPAFRYYPWNDYLLLLFFISILATYAFFVSAIVDIVAGDDVKKLRKTGMLMWIVSMVLIIPLLFFFGIIFGTTNLDIFPFLVTIMLAVFSIGMSFYNLVEYLREGILQRKNILLEVAAAISVIFFAYLLRFIGIWHIIFIISWVPLLIVIIEILKFYTKNRYRKKN